MRTAFHLALALAILALAIELTARLTPDRRGELEEAGGGVVLRIPAQGALLPPGRLAGGEERLVGSLLVGDLTLRPPLDVPGLRWVRLQPGGNFGGWDVIEEQDDPSRLAELARHTKVGELLVLANRGRLAPRGEREREELADLLRALGATTEPLDREPVSWTLVTEHSAAGWSPVAEACSHETGLVLTATWDGDAEAGQRAAPYRPALDASARVRLDRELPAAAEVASDVLALEGSPVGGLRLASILFPSVPGDGGETAPTRRVRWDAVPLGSAPRFSGTVGLRDGSWARSDGAAFALRIDGEEVHREDLTLDPGQWRLWDLDLARFAGRTVSLELVVEPLGHGRGDVALWGVPMLSYEPTTDG